MNLCRIVNMDIVNYFLFWLVGLIAGMFAGLLGIGGGVIVVPLLYLIFQEMKFPSNDVMPLAVATSLSTMIVTGFASSFARAKKRGFEKQTLYQFIPGIIAGCCVGVIASKFIGGVILAKTFGVILFLMGIYFIIPKLPDLHLGTFSLAKKISWSTGIGFFSTLLGIGGGVVAVPVLMGFGLSFNKSAALSSVITFLIAFFATIGYLISGINIDDNILTLGYIYLPAAGFICLGTIISSPIGVKLAYLLPKSFLKNLFSIVLIATGITMIFH